jgi:alkyldihydroxyacetonephosphate synthase
MIDRQTVVAGLSGLLGKEKVVADKQALEEAEGYGRMFESAFGYKPTTLALAEVKAYSTEDVAKAVRYCYEHNLSVIAKTGQTSGEDHLKVINGHTVFIDAGPMNKLINLDEENMMATVGCGMPLVRLEEFANAKGLTTGHCPQSQPLAYMGGLVATRSIGQFSTYYGGIEDMVCGLEAVMPDGEIIRIRNNPRRSCGPDIRHLFIGSEGSLAVITEVTVKLFTFYPNDWWKGGYIIKDFITGLGCIREVLAKGYRPSVVRLYDKPDVDKNYGSVKLKDEEAFMFFIAEGPPSLAKATGEDIDRICKSHGASYIGIEAVDHWLRTRNNICDTFGSEETKETFRQTKTTYGTVEISADWSDIKKIYADVMANVPPKIPNLAMLGGHVSHSYQNGTNIYFVYDLKIADPLKASEEAWGLMQAICTEVLKQSTGSICHHHGIGKWRVNLMTEEYGSSMRLLHGLKDMMDPKGIMNPGNLIPLIKFDDTKDLYC